MIRVLIQILSFFVHARIPLAAADSPFFHELFRRIRPSYSPPSQFTLSEELLASEYAEVLKKEMGYLEAGWMFTFLLDGWEDRLRRSQYASIAQRRGEPGVLLHMENMTGKRVDGEELRDFANRSLEFMNMTSRQLIAVCTDNPRVMQKFRRIWGEKYFWLIVSARKSMLSPWLLTETSYLRVFCIK